MLRSISSLPLSRHNAILRTAAPTLTRGLAIGKTGPKPRDPNRVRGDSDYVKRRRAYQNVLHEQRIAFQEAAAQSAEDQESETGLNAEAQAEKEARVARKRAKSEAKQVRRKELLEEIQKMKQVGVAYRKKDWEMKQRELRARRNSDLQLLMEKEGEWITEENLDGHVERALHEFFFAKGAEEKVEVKGW